jgi:nucleotide-binding universal stress UspA family protein
MSTTSSSPYIPPEQSIPHLDTFPVHIKNIVAAIDFSEQSIWAAKYAARLAKQLDSRLILLHVVLPELYMTRPALLAADLAKLELERGRNDLHEFASKIPEVRIMRHEESVLCGPAAEMIQEAAEVNKADLLIMGSHARSGVSKLALGSVAENVIRHQHRPVLVVGPQSTRRYLPLKSIILATDLRATSLRAAQYATSITHQSGATLTITHVVPKHAGNLSAHAEKHIRRDLHMLIPHDQELAKHAYFKILRGDVSEEILRCAKIRSAGLIIIGAKDRSVIADHAPQTTLSSLIREARCPILAVPPHLG